MKMDHGKWAGRKHTLRTWVAKLGEEFGEVNRELSDPDGVSIKQLRKAKEELEHLEFISKWFRNDIERRLAEGAK